MADIILNKPEAGTQAVFEAAGDSRIDLNFPTDQATLERSGNDLIFRFDDGSTVVLRDFYTAYTKDSMPDFVIEGTPIAGEQFFTALNEPDLMPAAGPAANAASADGGRFREYADDALINGVNRLDGLDLSSNRAFFPERDPWGGLRGDDTPNYAPTLSVSGSLGVIESGVFPGGNELYEGVPSMSGRATGTDANGDTLSFGFIDANGAQVTSIVTPYGVMAMAPDGTYTYTIDNADPDTNGLALGETRTETFTVYVSDGRGGLATQEITVTLTGTNDRPELSIANAAQGIHEDTASVGGTFAVQDPDSDSGQNQTFHIEGGSNTPAADGTSPSDGSHSATGSTDATFTTDYGKLTLDPATGQWTYALNNASDKVVRDLINDYDTVIFDQFGQMVMNATTAASIDEAKNDVRVVLHLHPALAPYKAAILPLSKKLAEPARKIYQDLCSDFMLDYDDTGSIGKRYRREDEIGTPYCITVDFATVGDDKTPADNAVTIRERDSMEQVRVPISELKSWLAEHTKF